MTAWMYILECADGTYHVGSTYDLERRLDEHLSGVGSKYTSDRLPVRLVYAEEYGRISDASFREEQLQSWSPEKLQALIHQNYEMFSRLAKKIKCPAVE